MSNEPGSLVGATIGGVYSVRRLIGTGGMGEVYAAEGKRREKVAIKVLHDRAAQDPDLVARFQREAEIAARIQSPYVAAVLGAGKDRNGRLWIAFERLHGEGLDAGFGVRERRADPHPRLRRLQGEKSGPQRLVAHGLRRHARQLRVHGARAGPRLGP